MEHRKISQPIKGTATNDSQMERRFAVSGLELRKSDSGTATLRGYALRFGSAYNMGWFTEEVAQGALDKADLSDVRILFNHDPNQILGRTAAQTARVGVDNEGLWYEVDLPDSPNGENARAAVERGDVTQSSWGFTLRRDDVGKSIGDKWEVKDGKKHRVLTDIDVVFDASPVVYPANPDTSIAKRNASLAGLEVRDEGEDEIEVMVDTVTEGEPAEQWTLQWMIDNLIWATATSNDAVTKLNNRIGSYEYYAKQGHKESPIFERLATSCKTVKAAMVDLLSQHLDAIKELNMSENRADNSVIEHEKNEADPSTDHIQKQMDDEMDYRRRQMMV